MKMILAFVASILISLAPSPADGTSIDLYGAFFKAGHPTTGESLESSVSDAREIENLRRTVATLNKFPDMHFDVSGHTDHYECQAKSCNELAQRRAILVYRFLLDAGISGRRLTQLTKYSWTRPISGTRSDFALNQRAEVNISQDP